MYMTTQIHPRHQMISYVMELNFFHQQPQKKNIVTVTHAAAPSWEDTINGIPIKNQDKINGVLVSAREECIIMWSS